MTRNAKLMHGFFLGVLICTRQASSQKPKIAAAPVNYAKAKEWDISIATPMSKNSHKLAFSLTTSWIPGEGHKGYMRYKGLALSPDLDGAANSKFIEQAHDCRFFLDLVDSQGFKLRSLETPYFKTVKDDGNTDHLETNEMVQMDLEEYKSFLVGGSWSVSWIHSGSCQ